MRKGIILAFAALTLLAGCENQSTKTTGIPVDAKWKGAPYRLAFDTQAAKPNPTGVTIPPVKFTANPEALETRAILVIRFDAAGAANKGPVANRMIEAPVDIHGAEGTLPADYIDRTNKNLSTFLTAYCVKGNVKITVALARSSLSPTAGDSDIENKRLSDWIPIELPFKNPHPKC